MELKKHQKEKLRKVLTSVVFLIAMVNSSGIAKLLSMGFCVVRTFCFSSYENEAFVFGWGEVFDIICFIE